jgi:hypothetical protein
MPRKGEMSLVDENEQKIRDNAEQYNVTFFQPGTSTRLGMAFLDLNVAMKYCEVTLKEPNRIRSAMIYAVDKAERFALVGSMDRSLIWKPVAVKTG